MNDGGAAGGLEVSLLAEVLGGVAPPFTDGQIAPRLCRAAAQALGGRAVLFRMGRNDGPSSVAAHPPAESAAELTPALVALLVGARRGDAPVVLAEAPWSGSAAAVPVVAPTGVRWLLLVDGMDAAAAAAGGELAELARVARLALTTGSAVAEVERARRAADAAQHRVIAVSRLVELVPESLDQQATVEAVLAALVPYVGDWAVLYLDRPDGELELAGAQHVSRRGERLLRELGTYPLPAEAEARQEWLAREEPRALEPAELAAAAGADGERAAALAPVSALAASLRSAGKAFGLLVVGTSQSGQRYGRDELRLVRELAKQAGLALSSARLYAAAERARREREDVVAIVSHDLRNPLHTIRFASSLLALPETTDEKRGQHLARLDKAVGHMERLLQDLLDASRIEAGRFSVEPRPCAAGALLDEACRAVQAQADPKRIELVVEPSPAVEVAADHEAVLRVLGNLLSNALSFTPKGGRVTLALEPADEVAWFRVRDSGPGIPPEVLPHVFDRYWQARRATHSGAGLGLAIARGIVEAHGGEIVARNAPEGGAELRFSLRRVQPAQPAR